MRLSSLQGIMHIIMTTTSSGYIKSSIRRCYRYYTKVLFIQKQCGEIVLYGQAPDCNIVSLYNNSNDSSSCSSSSSSSSSSSLMLSHYYNKYSSIPVVVCIGSYS